MHFRERKMFIQISLKFVLGSHWQKQWVYLKIWYQTSNKPLHESMMIQSTNMYASLGVCVSNHNMLNRVYKYKWKFAFYIISYSEMVEIIEFFLDGRKKRIKLTYSLSYLVVPCLFVFPGYPGVVSITFHGLSKIITANLCIAEIVFIMRIMALGTCMQFQLEFLTINVIFGNVYFLQIILESLRSVNSQKHDIKCSHSPLEYSSLVKIKVILKAQNGTKYVILKYPQF